MERKYSNGGRASLIQHSESGKHRKIADGNKRTGNRMLVGSELEKIKGQLLISFFSHSLEEQVIRANFSGF